MYDLGSDLIRASGFGVQRYRREVKLVALCIRYRDLAMRRNRTEDVIHSKTANLNKALDNLVNPGKLVESSPKLSSKPDITLVGRSLH